ncbi:uncharacterized protein ISCGN_003411 [Ixodes scapularis]
MDLNKLRRPDLILLSKELGLDLGGVQRKPLIIEAIRASGADDVELRECWELIEERIKKEEERVKKEEERQEREIAERERERLYRRESEERELERKKLELQIAQVEAERAGRETPSSRVGQATPRLKMKDLLQPFKIKEDIGLFLVNFERTCEKMDYSRDTWPQWLLTVLPCEAADVVARLERAEADDYDKVKSALLKKYRLSADAFRRRFRTERKKSDESFSEFAYNLKSNLVEWLKGEEALGDHDKVVECIGLEQFYNCLTEETRLWVQDRPGVKTLERAADLAEEFALRRDAERSRVRLGANAGGEPSKKVGAHGKENAGLPGEKGGDRGEQSPAFGKEKDIEKKAESEKKKAYEARKPLVCFRCQEPGHISSGCRKPRVVFSFVSDDEESTQYLRPYLHDLVVNGKACSVLRDSAATLDIIHPDYVSARDYTGECAWIRQAVEESSVCLPMARVEVKGPFGVLCTVAAVSKNLPGLYPYLFSNRSDAMLRAKGLSFPGVTAQPVTTARVREQAASSRAADRSKMRPAQSSRKVEAGVLSEPGVLETRPCGDAIHDAAKWSIPSSGATLGAVDSIALTPQEGLSGAPPTVRKSWSAEEKGGPASKSRELRENHVGLQRRSEVGPSRPDGSKGVDTIQRAHGRAGRMPSEHILCMGCEAAGLSSQELRQKPDRAQVSDEGSRLSLFGENSRGSRGQTGHS